MGECVLSKRLKLFVAFAVIASVVVFPSASRAQDVTIDTTTQLLPNQNDDSDALSDAFDGVDSSAHLSAIADPAATQGTWYVCTADGSGGAAPGSGGCSVIGADSSGTQPPGGDPDPDEDTGGAEAYDFFWNIPGSLDSDAAGLRDVWFVACAGTPGTPAAPASSSNCRGDEQTAVYLDDFATRIAPEPSLEDMPSGEIRNACSGGDGGDAPTECDELDEGENFSNGAGIPPTDLAITYMTSDDVTQSAACIETLSPDGLVDVDQSAIDPLDCDVYPEEVLLLGEAHSDDPDPGHAWVAYFDDNAIPESEDVLVAVFGSGEDSAGECGIGYQNDGGNVNIPIVNDEGDPLATYSTLNDCGVVFDIHYALTDPLEVSGTAVSFDDESKDIGCEEDDDEDIESSRTNLVEGQDTPSSHQELIEGCVQDQFGELLGNRQVTFEIDGPGEFTGGNCDAMSIDDEDDGVDEVCVSDAAGPDSVYDTIVRPIEDENGTLITGDVTVTFCVDAEGDDTDDAQFGCADEEDVSTLTKSFIGFAVDVSLVFETEGAGTPTDPCSGGDAFRTVEEGTEETLLVCTYDDQGTLVSTDAAHLDGVDNGVLSWQNSAPTVAALDPTPPTETGAAGTVEASLDALSEGGASISVTLDPRVGADQSSTVVLTVEAAPPPAACGDGVDNDSDGKTDFPDDPGCSGLEDNSEVDPSKEHVRRVIFKSLEEFSDDGIAKLRASGRVRSDHPRCKNFVTVRVQFRQRGKWVTRDSDETNRRGRWSARFKSKPGLYRASVQPLDFRKNGVNHFCLGANSNTRTIR